MPLIVTEVPIGAGKTRLSRLLAQKLRARLVLEAAEYDFVGSTSDREKVLADVLRHVQVA